MQLPAALLEERASVRFFAIDPWPYFHTLMVINWQFPDGGWPQNRHLQKSLRVEFLFHHWIYSFSEMFFSPVFSHGFFPGGVVAPCLTEDVTSEEGRSWRVMRRFNDFWQLKEQLGPSARKLPRAPFPRSSWESQG